MIEVVVADITTMPTDAIVNAAVRGVHDRVGRHGRDVRDHHLDHLCLTDGRHRRR